MVFRYFIAFLFFVCFRFDQISGRSVDKEWEDYKRMYSKAYTPEEENRRKSIWLQNIDTINKHNLEADMGLHSYRLGMNEFGDMSNKEFASMLNGARGYPTVNGSTFIPPYNLKLPTTLNWTKEGYVTPVKNQGRCGSCWAFATTGGLEGQHFRKTGKLVSLSEQNLVDCSKENLGCTVGLVDNAFRYIAKNGGIDTEESYPYSGKNGSCKFRQSEVGATCKGFVQIPPGDELVLQKAVASIGPLTVWIFTSKSFFLYKEGVFDDKECSKLIPTHFVLLVGYGDLKGKDYWLVKNSWGTSWGMDGYIMMSRNEDNQCGIATHAVYPIV